MVWDVLMDDGKNLMWPREVKRIMPQGKKTVEDDEIVKAMVESDDPAFIASEIADMVGMSVEGVRLRLELLEDEGRVVKKKPGNSTAMWWHERQY